MKMKQRALRLPEMKRRAKITLQRCAHILKHCHVRKHSGDLKRTHDAAARCLRGRLSGDVAAVELDAAASRKQKFGQQIEEGCFTRAVRPDQRVNVAALNFKIDAIHGDESFEFFAEAARFKNVFSGQKMRSSESDCVG